MSHVSKIDLEIKDLDTLEAAAKSCDMELVRGQTTMKWFGRFVNDYHGDDAAYKHGISPGQYGKCHHVLRIPGNNEAYEVGVLDNGDGTFQLYYDHWGTSGKAIIEKIGRAGEKLKQNYVKTKAIQTLQKKGFTLIKEEGLASGGIKITLRGQLNLAN